MQSNILNKRLLPCFVGLLLTVCWLSTTARAGGQMVRIARPVQIAPERVLVVANQRSEDSRAIADYYAQKRHIPRANICTISCPTTEDCSQHEYDAQIESFIGSFLTNRPGIDFIVLTKGIPIRTLEHGQSVDSALASLGAPNRGAHMKNPYFNKSDRFSFERYQFRLVTRLDGYTREQCLKLVDNALAARPEKGLFLLHAGPGHAEIQSVNDAIHAADTVLKAKGFETAYDTKDPFPGNIKNLMGYYSWGSNDLHFNKAAYNSLGFLPGAIAETVVSTGGRTFRNPNAPGQSLIADLIAQGVTGCKGYVYEPASDAIAHAALLFDRYTSGFSLAESFYMASRYIDWKDVVIGDPICAPYARKGE
jgi:uncharacterized protein (TIGR03790 family)